MFLQSWLRLLRVPVVGPLAGLPDTAAAAAVIPGTDASLGVAKA